MKVMWVNKHSMVGENSPLRTSSDIPMYFATDVEIAIAQAKREVWLEAAKFVESGWEDVYGQPIRGIQSIADAIRQQVEKVKR